MAFKAVKGGREKGHIGRGVRPFPEKDYRNHPLSSVKKGGDLSLITGGGWGERGEVAWESAAKGEKKTPPSSPAGKDFKMSYPLTRGGRAGLVDQNLIGTALKKEEGDALSPPVEEGEEIPLTRKSI